MNPEVDDSTLEQFHDVEHLADSDATAEQLADLRRLGVAESDCLGLTSFAAADWIDVLRIRRRDADRFGPLRRHHTPLTDGGS